MSRPCLVLLLASLAGCTSSASHPASAVDSGALPPVDAGGGADGVGPPPTPSCFTNPHTYLEIINACTDAQAIDKQEDLSPMNLPDGALRPLP